MASYIQFRVDMKNRSPRPDTGDAEKLVLTFTNKKAADDFDTWLIINCYKYEVSRYALCTSEADAKETLAVFDR